MSESTEASPPICAPTLTCAAPDATDAAAMVNAALAAARLSCLGGTFSVGPMAASAVHTPRQPIMAAEVILDGRQPMTRTVPSAGEAVGVDSASSFFLVDIFDLGKDKNPALISSPPAAAPSFPPRPAPANKALALRAPAPKLTEAEAREVLAAWEALKAATTELDTKTDGQTIHGFFLVARCRQEKRRCAPAAPLLNEDHFSHASHWHASRWHTRVPLHRHACHLHASHWHASRWHACIW